MLSLSFSSFMLVLLFMILLVINDAIAHTDNVKQNFVVDEAGNGIAKTSRSHLNVEKEDFDGATPETIQVASGRIGGRKRMLEQRNMRQSRKKIEGMMPNRGQEKLRIQSKLNCKNSHSDNVKVNRGSFTAFSADYHMPRTHPPKNN